MNKFTACIIFLKQKYVIDLLRWVSFTLTFLSTLQYGYIAIEVLGWATQMGVVMVLNTASHGIAVLYFILVMLSEHYTTRREVSLFGLVLSSFSFMVDVPALVFWMNYGIMFLIVPFVSLISISTTIIYLELKQDDVLYNPRDNTILTCCIIPVTTKLINHIKWVVSFY